jgi:TRAP-type C4-dicarboxylate transport system permease small subunit
LIHIYKKGMVAALVTMVGSLLVVMGVQIVLRYFFNSSLIWAEEVCRYLLIWVSFLGAALAYERGEVAAFTMLRDALPDRWGIYLAIACNLVAALLCAVLVVYGLRFAEMVGSQPIPAARFLLEDTLHLSPQSVPTVFWVYFSLPLGIGLLCLRFLIDIFHYFTILRSGGNAADLRAGVSGEAV